VGLYILPSSGSCGIPLILTGTTGKAIIKHMIVNHASRPDTPTLSNLLEELGLSRTSSSSADLTALCQQAVDKLPDVAESIRKGNEKVAMRLVGEVMKISGGKADAKKAREIILALVRGQSQ
jgi:aspartyl-tRNA(Asn)/glutamyl-tRNA(Gln) amidotransferase subunit B